jgi:hypothetical protein
MPTDYDVQHAVCRVPPALSYRLGFHVSERPGFFNRLCHLQDSTPPISWTDFVILELLFFIHDFLLGLSCRVAEQLTLTEPMQQTSPRGKYKS